MKLLSIKSSPPKFCCNVCGKFKYDWQFHWRIVGVERLKVCKTCRNLVNQKGNSEMNKKVIVVGAASPQITMSDAQKLLDTYTDEEITFPFGKYKNILSEEIPNYYLEWFLDFNWTTDSWDYLIIPVEKELAYRKEFDVYISGE